jgi:exonuclease SbcC
VGDVQKKLNESKEKLHEISKRTGEIEREMVQIREKLARREELKEQIDRTVEKLRIYEVLREDLKSDRLQEFASSLMLRRIIDRSGEYLIEFTGNYEFNLDERGEIVVIDRTDGSQRAVNSLSGGETFLASLSLALGVSDILSANAHLESLFIDEGFGSLDEDTRERVSDILEAIKQKINRMVGIISHIPDLADRFHQRIKVIKEETGSRLEIVY